MRLRRGRIGEPAPMVPGRGRRMARLSGEEGLLRAIRAPGGRESLLARFLHQVAYLHGGLLG
eukprot:5388450-Lingulodinium_polyedra.AAC.1